MMDWIWIIMPIPLGELIFYWVLPIVLGMIASAGWALYLTERKKRRDPLESLESLPIEAQPKYKESRYTKAILTLQLPRGNRFIPIAVCVDLDVLRHFKRNVLSLWERELELADDEIVAFVRRAEVEKLRRTLDLLIPDRGAPDGKV